MRLSTQYFWWKFKTLRGKWPIQVRRIETLNSLHLFIYFLLVVGHRTAIVFLVEVPRTSSASFMTIRGELNNNKGCGGYLERGDHHPTFVKDSYPYFHIGDTREIACIRECFSFSRSRYWIPPINTPKSEALNKKSSTHAREEVVNTSMRAGWVPVTSRQTRKKGD